MLPLTVDYFQVVQQSEGEGRRERTVIAQPNIVTKPTISPLAMISLRRLISSLSSLISLTFSSYQ